METKSKRRGRPTTGKVLFQKRILPDLAERIDGMIAAELESRREGNAKATDEWLRKTYGVAFNRADLVENPKHEASGDKKAEIIRELNENPAFAAFGNMPTAPIRVEPDYEKESLRYQLDKANAKIKEYETMLNGC